MKDLLDDLAGRQVPFTPLMPLAQNLQPTGQPTCELTQAVRRSPSGIMTVSACAPSGQLSSSLRVPSELSWFVCVTAAVRRTQSASAQDSAVAPSTGWSSVRVRDELAVNPVANLLAAETGPAPIPDQTASRLVEAESPKSAVRVGLSDVISINLYVETGPAVRYLPTQDVRMRKAAVHERFSDLDRPDDNWFAGGCNECFAVQPRTQPAMGDGAGRKGR